MVRGVIAVDRELNLALLEINRRFVVSLADPNIASPDDPRIVPGQSLLLCRAPTPDNPYPAIETKIESRPTHSTLDLSAQTRHARLQPVGSPEYWLVHSKGHYAEPGTLLVDDKTQLAAIHIFSIDGKGYALPVRKWRQMLTDTQPVRQPLSALATDGASQVVAPDQKTRQHSIKLNVLAERCRSFGWLPEKKSDYKTLVKFAQSLREANEAVDQEVDAKTSAVLQQQINGYQNAFAKDYATKSPKTIARIKTLNRLTEDRLGKSNRTVVFAGSSYFVSSLKVPTVVLKLPGSDELIAIPVAADQPPLRPKYYWLVFAQTPKRKNIREFSDDETALQLKAIAEPWPLAGKKFAE